MDQQQATQMAAGFVGIAVIFGLIITAALIFLYWRCLSRAGMSGALSLLVLVPGIGFVIPLCILAFGEWRVMPIAAAVPYYPPPSYPPPPPSDWIVHPKQDPPQPPQL